MLFHVFIYLIITSTTFLTFLHIQTLKFTPHFTFPSTTSWRRLSQNATNNYNHIAFLPLKDIRFSDTPMDGNTWFMSSLNDTFHHGETEHLAFPSDASNGRLLCLAGASTSNGTMNSYALAPPEALPPDSMLLPGLTFVSDTYYGYDNLYHGLSAVSPFVAWHGRKECVRPARWVLYHKGEVRMKMSSWVRKLMEAVFGRDMELEGFDGDGNGGGGHGPRCFENAVVFRHQEGRMVRERKEEVYEMMRCKARDYCNVDVGDDDDEGVVRLTLLLRVGKRSFKDDEAVIRVFEEECKKVVGCRLMVVRPNDIPSFCDQVKLFSATDIVATPHGAQLTNMIFMDKNGSIMEFFPKGWKELAGVGQYVFRWSAIASGMRHQGAWNDPKGDRCPYDEESKCFPFYKDRQLGHDTAYFANWTAAILKETMEYKTSRRSSTGKRRCSCT